MMTDRIASYGAADVALSNIEKKRFARKQSEVLKETQQKKLKHHKSVVELVSTSEESDTSAEEDGYAQSTLKRSHKRIVKTGTTIFIPHDILRSPHVVSTSIRNKITPTAMSSTMTSIIAACGGETNVVNLHWSSAYRYKIEGASVITDKIKGNWKPPKVGLLHWDGKLENSLGMSIEQARRTTTNISFWDWRHQTSWCTSFPTSLKPKSW